MRTTLRLTAAFAVLMTAPAVEALVNPSFQPSHLYERYKVVLSGEVVSAELSNDDETVESGTVKLKVTGVYKGEFPGKEIVIDVPAIDDRPEVRHDPCPDWNIWDAAYEGHTFVAYVGSTRRRGEKEILFCCGEHVWHHAGIGDLAMPAAWTCHAAGDAEAPRGTFNGSALRLAQMMRDMQNGVAYFPPEPTVKLIEDVNIGKLPGPGRGVALFDLDDDGDLDVMACSEKGVLAYLQDGPMKFVDATEKLGLKGVSGRSCSLADVNGDGRSDLLIDSTVFLKQEGAFAKGKALSVSTDKPLRASSFVQLNGDGHADVLISREGGGLAAHLNDGKGGFTDGTARLGLSEEACGAGGSGYFAPGDLNDDGRTDLYYATGKGLVLVQDARGTFSPFKHGVSFDYNTPPDYEPR